MYLFLSFLCYSVIENFFEMLDGDNHHLTDCAVIQLKEFLYKELKSLNLYSHNTSISNKMISIIITTLFTLGIEIIHNVNITLK